VLGKIFWSRKKLETVFWSFQNNISCAPATFERALIQQLLRRMVLLKMHQ